MAKVPTFDLFMNPILEALKILGGSGTIEEINSQVIEKMKLSNDQLEVLHDPEKGAQTEIEYRLAWARTYLKKYELLENSSRGVWALTPKGSQLDQIDPKAIKHHVQNQDKVNRSRQDETVLPDSKEDEPSWREQAMASLLTMEPSAFERLIQRMLRESGFIQVDVTGRTGDGGIDGKGIMRLGGLMSFHVIFQCKRYRGTVGSGQIRDFRGAMVGRADKGLFVTTGNYSKDAIVEATRDGAPAIDLMDGDQLIDKLKELALGIKSQKIEIEQITVDVNWFSAI